MMKVSTSPDRYTFQKNSYIEERKRLGEPIDHNYIKMYDDDIAHDKAWAESNDHQNDLEWDLRTTEWILNLVRSSDVYAQHLYAAICNNSFKKLSSNSETWSCSWRYAGGIIAHMREQGDYIDWYCSGIRCENIEYVNESTITDKIQADLKKLGWAVV